MLFVICACWSVLVLYSVLFVIYVLVGLFGFCTLCCLLYMLVWSVWVLYVSLCFVIHLWITFGAVCLFRVVCHTPLGLFHDVDTDG